MASKILVFGSYVADLMARAPHIPVEGETVKGTYFKMGPGGKGFNQAVAVHRAGGAVTMASKIGDDAFGQYALKYMRQIGMDTGCMLVTDKFGSSTALITVDENTGQNSIVVTLDACGNITPGEVDDMSGVIRGSAYMLTQLETNVDAVERAVSIAHGANIKIILNPAPVQAIPDEVYAALDIITPNEVEAKLLTGVDVEDQSGALRAAEFFFKKGVKAVVITLGHRGALVAAHEAHRLIPAFAVQAVDTTGAGDAFNGGLVTALAEGRDIWDATVFASALAALSVQKMGTSVSMPTRKEIDDFLFQNNSGI